MQPGFTQRGMEAVYALRNKAGMHGNRLKMIRQALPGKPSQGVMAERLGLSTAQISRWESGEDSIPSYRLPALAEAYGSTIGEIFEDPLPSISADEIAAMLESTRGELPANVSYADWPNAAAASLHTQLSQLQAARLAAVRKRQETARDKGVQSPETTKPAARG